MLSRWFLASQKPGCMVHVARTWDHQRDIAAGLRSGRYAFWAVRENRSRRDWLDVFYSFADVVELKQARARRRPVRLCRRLLAIVPVEPPALWIMRDDGKQLKGLMRVKDKQRAPLTVVGLNAMAPAGVRYYLMEEVPPQAMGGGGIPEPREDMLTRPVAATLTTTAQ